MEIYCCECKCKVDCNVVNGDIIYPNRPDLYNLIFFRCPVCLNYVGTHKGSLKPLGIIPNKQLRNARKHIHALLDPLWKNKIIKRSDLYNRISEKVGWKYHTAMIRNIEEARQIYLLLREIKKELATKA